MTKDFGVKDMDGVLTSIFASKPERFKHEYLTA